LIDSKAASNKLEPDADQETINTQRNKEKRERDEDLLHKLLDINPEGALLKEIKDILDELHMMMKVFNEQSRVVEDFSSHIQKLGGSNKFFPLSTREKTAKLVNDVSRRKAEVNELTQAAKRTADGVYRPL
jgi:GTP cyclohydrolase III